MNFQPGDKTYVRTKNFLNAENAKREPLNQFSIFFPSENNLTKKNSFAVNNLTSAKKSISILKTFNKNDEEVSLNKTEKLPICVISEVMGNANRVFSDSLSNKNLSEHYIITPKKTTDITKIKGWRRKQFLIEKPTTVEFYKGKRSLEEKISNQNKHSSIVKKKIIERNTENVGNAFVCESLDEFLNEKSQLEVNYEIPHLYAEVGIKLTSEEVYSKPNLSQDEFKKVETQYCTSLQVCDNDCIFIEKEKLCDTKKKIKRNEEKTSEFPKTQKIEEDKRQSKRIVQKQNEAKSKSREHPVVMPKEIKDSVDTENTLCPSTKYCHENYGLTSKLIGLVIYPNSFRPLHPLVQNHLFKLRSYNTKIDRHWANFAVLAVRIKSRNKFFERKIVPVYCPGKVKKSSGNEKSPIIEEEVKEVVKFLVNSACDAAVFSPIEKSKNLLSFADVKNDTSNSQESKGEKKTRVKSREKAQQLIKENGIKRKSVEAENFCKKLNANLNKICKTVNQNEKCKQTSSHIQLKLHSASIHTVSDNEGNVVEISTETSLKNQIQEKVSVLQMNEKKKVKILEEKDCNEISNISILKESLPIKECKVVIEKLKKVGTLQVWCMEHNSYNCSTCGLDSFSYKSNKEHIKIKKKIEENIDKNLVKKQFNQKFGSSLKKSKKILRAVPVSPKAYFDPKITSQLSTKLKDVNFTSDTLSSVDKLKILTPNVIELIKLNFVKQSFSSGSIKIWYSPPQSPSSRSRAFLTFSDMLSVSGAFDISTQQNCLTNLPKIITDMLSIEHKFTNNEFGILHCNGELWEIHGTLNIVLEKNNSCQETDEEEIEQIFSSVPLPEMDDFRNISTRILGVRATKWWVLDMSQRFTKIVLTTSSTTTSLAKVTFLASMKSQSSGFFPLTKDKGRLYGVYYFSTLYPFVLVGPFYVFEKNDKVSVAVNSSIRPFIYNGKENVNSIYPLKFFINSVIMCLKNSEKKLKGLWLYDKVYVDDTCYLEVITINIQGSFPKSDYSLETEHGYSMKSLTNFASGVGSSKSLNSNSAPVQFKPVPVYLYFEIFSLGYVTGELQMDNSILITHPLSPGFGIKSHKVGELFISLLKKRVKFIPHNLAVKWYVTKHPDDLGGREPFDKIWLGGVHILCKSGIFSLLQMTDGKIQDLGLNKTEVLHAASECKVLVEIIELKKLKSLLFEKSSGKVTMDVILRKAVEVIERLKEKGEILHSAKGVAEAAKVNSITNYVTFLNSCAISDVTKIKYLEKVAELLTSKLDGKLDVKFRELLEKFQFGKKYLMRFENLSNKAIVENTMIQINSDKEETNNDVKKEQVAVMENGIGTLVLKSILKSKPKALKKKKPKNMKAIKVSNRALIQTLETKMYNISKLLKNNAHSYSFPKYKELIKKLNRISNHLNNIKSIFKYGAKRSQKKKKKISEKKNKTGNNELVESNKAKKRANAEVAKTEQKFIKLDTLNVSQNYPNITVSNENSLMSKETVQYENFGEKLDQRISPIFKRHEPEGKPVLKNLRVVLTPLKKKYISSRKILVVQNIKNNKIQKISIINSRESEAKDKIDADCQKDIQNIKEGNTTDRKAKELENSSDTTENNLYKVDVT